MGAFGGAFIGALERQIRGDLVRPDVATLVCAIFGLVPALLVFLQGMGAVAGRLALCLSMGLVCMGPLIGLLVGAIFDRAFDARLRKSWGAALVFAVVRTAACLGLVWGFDALSYGPDPEEIPRRTRASIVTHWRKDPGMQDAKIDKLTLHRTGRTTYAGFVEATVAGFPERG